MRARFVVFAVSLFGVLLLSGCVSRGKTPSAKCLTALSAGQTVRVKETSDGWTFFLPSYADRDRITLLSTQELQIGDEKLSAFTQTEFPLTGNDPVLAVSAGGRTVDLHIRFSSKLPALFLSLDESRGSFSAMEADKEKKAACYGDGVLISEGCTAQKIGSLSLSGRGNSTWQREKNPYKLNLDKKADLLGMGSSKKWALLAMYDDPSLIRNLLGMQVASDIGFNYVPEGKLVDLYIGGVYKGTYTLFERIKIDPERLDVADLEEMIDAVLSVWNDAYETDYKTLSELWNAAPDACALSPDGTTFTVSLPAGDITIDLTQGYLLEIDFYKDTPQFLLPSGTKVTVKSPENLASDVSDPLFSYLSDHLFAAEASLDADSDVFLSFFDTDSFAKAWLLKEFTMDFDACVSLYMVLSPDGKFQAGPIWDLENIFALNRTIYGNADPLYQVVANGGRHETVESWLTKIARFPAFREAVKDAYKTCEEVFDGERVASYAQSLLDTASGSAKLNALLFPEKTREDESGFLLDFIRRRAEAFPTVVAEATK